MYCLCSVGSPLPSVFNGHLASLMHLHNHALSLSLLSRQYSYSVMIPSIPIHIQHRSMLLFTLFLSFITLVFSQSTSQQVFKTPSPSTSNFIVTSLSRSIELGGATSKASTVYTLRPSTSSDDVNERTFTFALEGRDAANLSWIEAFIGKTGNSKKTVRVERVEVDPGGLDEA